MDRPVGNLTVLLPFLHVRIAFAGLCVPPVTRQCPLCKLFLSRAVTGDFVGFHSDVFRRGIWTLQSLVSFRPHAPGRKCLQSWVELGMWGGPFPTESSELRSLLSHKEQFFFFETGSHIAADPPASTFHALECAVSHPLMSLLRLAEFRFLP